MISAVFTLLCLVELINTRTIDEFDQMRSDILRHEAIFSLGGGMGLSDDEKQVNNLLMKLKEEEINQAFYNAENFNFSRHYFTYRDHIEQSRVYSIIKRMPKGAALHVHSTFTLDENYLLTLTYEDHLYACYTKDLLTFRYSLSVPDRPCASNWTLISELRQASENVTAFDADIKRHLTLYSKDEEDLDMDVNKVWQKFDSVHSTVKSLILYRPVREMFIYTTLQKFYDDNVMYVEMRSGLHRLYELDGTEHDSLYFVRLHRDITNKFIEDHPDFVGMKMIVTKHRKADEKALRETINAARKIKAEYPDMFAGFDLVGYEDKGKSLRELLPLLFEAKRDLNLYLHGGETNWYGTSSDDNLIDAVLLGSKRIGHAYSLSKHPVVMSMVKKQDIAIEVNVISNAVLALVHDVRNHPLATYISFGLPVVLSSDDPGVWGAEPLSHDFYISFIAVASKNADLKVLKHLALNSIKYSALDSKRKKRLEDVFRNRWNQFIGEVLRNSEVNPSTLKTLPSK